MNASVREERQRPAAALSAAAPETPETQDLLLRLENIEVIYGGAILAVSGVSLAAPKGGIVALLGANGAGKSTVLKAISGLAQADRAQVSRGRIFFEGQPFETTSPGQRVRQGITHVLEGRHVFPHLTVEENLCCGGFLRRPSRARLNEKLERIYHWFPRLKEKRKTAAGYASGGEQQMIALGRALMTEPTLVLLDEPSMGLAPMIVQEIFEIVSQLNAQENMSFLVAEQNIPLALKYATHGYVLETGKVALQGKAQALLHNAALEEAYLGRKDA
jgi:branched-chain amino acid transport system ATP-binding protein